MVHSAEIEPKVLVRANSLSSTLFSSRSRRFSIANSPTHGTGRHRICRLVVSLTKNKPTCWPSCGGWALRRTIVEGVVESFAGRVMSPRGIVLA
jgi:hypothetical protein